MNGISANINSGCVERAHFRQYELIMGLIEFRLYILLLDFTARKAHLRDILHAVFSLKYCSQLKIITE